MCYLFTDEVRNSAVIPEASDNEGVSKGLSGEANAAPLASPFCRELRSKKYFMIDRIPVDANDYLDESNHCWCGNTQMVIGPDGSRATPDYCVPGRSCYRSAFEDNS